MTIPNTENRSRRLRQNRGLTRFQKFDLSRQQTDNSSLPPQAVYTTEQIARVSEKSDQIAQELKNAHEKLDQLRKEQRLITLAQFVAGFALIGAVFSNLILSGIPRLQGIDVAAVGAVASSVVAFAFYLGARR